MPDVVTTALQASIAGWSAALAADAISPQPTYTFENQTYDQAGWRDKLTKLIEDAQNVINQRNPTITWQRAFTGQGNGANCGGYYW